MMLPYWCWCHNVYANKIFMLRWWFLLFFSFRFWLNECCVLYHTVIRGIKEKDTKLRRDFSYDRPEMILHTGQGWEIWILDDRIQIRLIHNKEFVVFQANHELPITWLAVHLLKCLRMHFRLKLNRLREKENEREIMATSRCGKPN